MYNNNDTVLFSDHESELETVCQGKPIFYTFICIAKCACGNHSQILDAKPHLKIHEEPQNKPKSKNKQIHMITLCRICQKQSFSRYELCGVCRVGHCRICLEPKEARISVCFNCQPQGLKQQIKLGAPIPCRKCQKMCHSHSKLCRTCKTKTCVSCPNDRASHSIYCADCAKVFNHQTCVFGDDGYPRYFLLDKKVKEIWE